MCPDILHVVVFVVTPDYRAASELVLLDRGLLCPQVASSRARRTHVKSLVFLLYFKSHAKGGEACQSLGRKAA